MASLMLTGLSLATNQPQIIDHIRFITKTVQAIPTFQRHLTTPTFHYFTVLIFLLKGLKIQGKDFSEVYLEVLKLVNLMEVAQEFQYLEGTGSYIDQLFQYLPTPITNLIYDQLFCLMCRIPTQPRLDFQ